MANTGNITFHNAGTCPLFFMYALVAPGNAYNFCDVKLNFGIVKGGRELFYKIPAGYHLDWRFAASEDDQNVVTRGFLPYSRAIGQVICVGAPKWA